MPTPTDISAPSTYDHGVRFEVLGPLRIAAAVGAGGAGPRTDRPLGGPKQRLVVALLLAEPNTAVSVDRLIDGVWGDSPPESARHTLQAYVSELRKTVGDVIERDGAGYRIHVDRDALDALDFEARVTEARARLDAAPAEAALELDAAIALWRGRPFEDQVEHASIEAEVARLEELRLVAIEARATARLAMGEHAVVVADLERLTREHPYREELRWLQMLALYRCGRQADALRAFQAIRTVLAEEVGIDPSPRLRRLEEQILLQDPELDLPGASRVDPRPAGRSRTRTWACARSGRPTRPGSSARTGSCRRWPSGSTPGRPSPPSSAPAVRGSPARCGPVSSHGCGGTRRACRVATMQPGAQPFAELEAALAAVAPGDAAASLRGLRRSDHGLLDVALGVLDDPAARLVLVIDQFEELFTIADGDEASAMIGALVTVAHDPRRRVQLVVTMRADFYDRPLADPRLGALFAQSVVNVVPLGPDELEDAATLPARQVDVVVEPRLLGRLLVDVAGQPNALPLFQYALTELFDERSGAVLDLETYERVGGLRKAVARRAESIYTHLSRPEQEAVRQLFLRVATVTGETVGRRRVPASELAALDVDIVALQEAIDAFTRYRLLVLDRDPTTGAPTVEVAHEALLAEWDRLRGWIDESRDDLLTHARLVVALNEWESSGRDPGYLLTGTRLDDYSVWAAGSRMQLTEPEAAYLDAAGARRDAAGLEEQARQAQVRRQRRRSRWQLVGLFVVVAVLAGIVAYPLLTDPGSPDRIAIALSFERDQSGFDELMARGVERAAEDHDLEAVVIEPPYASAASLQEELADEAELVFGAPLMWEHMLNAAPDHPDTTFVFLDWFDPPTVANGVGVTFAHEQGSFLVGAAAALESTTGRIGYLGANSSPLIEPFRAGFEQGARAVRPGVEIFTAVIAPEATDAAGGYDEPATARALAERMYVQQDVDVIYTAAGASGQGAIEAATVLSDQVGRHLWAIGVDTDYAFELPEAQRAHLLTSMLKRLDDGIEWVVARHEDGTLTVPATVRLGLADNGVGYSTSGGHLSDATLSRLDELEAGIVSGAIVVPLEPERPLTDL